ncbi:Glutathione S-transferase, C-terminal [Dillenia turbinata]|uniref:glutathione transferase n=1 Tax=Dillenia turbinata TaxID=194707 RepID=A0AAN8W090_9MAGN
MGGLRVHGSPFSTATMRVLAVFHEKELEYDFVQVDMKSGEHKTDKFLALNPFGQVPAFEDGDIKMFESRAITQYLAHTYADRGTQLLFKEPKKMADQSVWVEVEAHHFDKVASKLAWELCLKPMFGMKTDEATAEELKGELGKVLDVYEARLSRTTFISGDAFGLADVHHAPVVHYLMSSPAKEVFVARPHVGKWAEYILSRPAWARVVALQNKE